MRIIRSDIEDRSGLEPGFDEIEIATIDSFSVAQSVVIDLNAHATGDHWFEVVDMDYKLKVFTT